MQFVGPTRAAATSKSAHVRPESNPGIPPIRHDRAKWLIGRDRLSRINTRPSRPKGAAHGHHPGLAAGTVRIAQPVAQTLHSIAPRAAAVDATGKARPSAAPRLYSPNGAFIRMRPSPRLASQRDSRRQMISLALRTDDDSLRYYGRCGNAPQQGAQPRVLGSG